jgi:hypothetical protein
MRRLLSCLCLFLLTDAVLEAQKYPIRLAAPNHVGDRYNLSASGSRAQRSSISKAGQVLQDATDEYSVNLTAVVEVLEVDRKGEPVRKAITIDKLTKSEKGAETVLLKSGTVVYTDGSQPKNKQVFVMSGTLDDTVRDAIDLVVTTHRPNSPTDDDVFGTADQKAIGESWSINTRLAAEDAANNGLSVSAENLSGKVSAIAKDTVAGVDCLSIAATLNAEGVRPPSFPPGVTFEQGRLSGNFAGCYPFSDAAFPNRQSMSLAIQVRAKGAAGTPMDGVTVDLTFQQKAEMLATKTK